MTSEVTRLVKEAAEAAKHAPEHLQEAAFNKAFEALVAAQPHTAKGQKRPKKKPKTNGDAKDHSLDDLNRTAHPDVRHDDTALNNSLRLLRAAKDDLGIDGLSAATIARVLVDKFRCRVTRQAVSLALNGAGRYVNRHKEGNLVIFRIMAPSEEYLNKLKAPTEIEGTTSQEQSRKKKKAVSTLTTAKKKVKKNITKSTKKGSAKRKVGSFAAFTKLYETGFFSSARTITAIIDHLKHKHGRTFKPNEMSPQLLRYLRTGKLTREKNPDKQYEYQQP